MPEQLHDSRPDTWAHIHRVQHWLLQAIVDLEHRSELHDATKLAAPELEAFDRFTPQLASTTYGSERYEALRAAMKPALDHHYAHERHHPEHYPDGIMGMSLLDLVEMVCDWKAATERHDNSRGVRHSIELNQARFGYSDDVKRLLLNTVDYMELDGQAG